MPATWQEIVQYLEKEYSLGQLFELQNGTDWNLQVTNQYLVQFVIGLTPNDQFMSGIDYYKYAMAEKFSKISAKLHFPAWPFYDYELDELKVTLNGLYTYFNILSNADDAIKKKKITKDQGGLYYVVITVVQYQVAVVIA